VLCAIKTFRDTEGGIGGGRSVSDFINNGSYSRDKGLPVLIGRAGRANHYDDELFGRIYQLSGFHYARSSFRRHGEMLRGRALEKDWKSGP